MRRRRRYGGARDGAGAVEIVRVHEHVDIARGARTRVGKVATGGVRPLEHGSGDGGLPQSVDGIEQSCTDPGSSAPPVFEVAGEEGGHLACRIHVSAHHLVAEEAAHA